MGYATQRIRSKVAENQFIRLRNFSIICNKMRYILSIVILFITTYVSEGTETCKNLETWCDAVNPDCQVKYVKEKCQKFCGLCPDQDWCEQAKPDCNTKQAKESCPKYCSKDDS